MSCGIRLSPFDAHSGHSMPVSPCKESNDMDLQPQDAIWQQRMQALLPPTALQPRPQIPSSDKFRGLFTDFLRSFRVVRFPTPVDEVEAVASPQLHHCDERCIMHQPCSSDWFVCTESGNGHFCSASRCNRAIHGAEHLRCELSGRIYPLEFEQALCFNKNAPNGYQANLGRSRNCPAPRGSKAASAVLAPIATEQERLDGEWCPLSATQQTKHEQAQLQAKHNRKKRKHAHLKVGTTQEQQSVRCLQRTAECVTIVTHYLRHLIRTSGVAPQNEVQYLHRLQPTRLAAVCRDVYEMLMLRSRSFLSVSSKYDIHYHILVVMNYMRQPIGFPSPFCDRDKPLVSFEPLLASVFKNVSDLRSLEKFKCGHFTKANTVFRNLLREIASKKENHAL